MKEEKLKKLQQDAFMWFRATYNQTPEEAEITEILPRVKRTFFFKHSQIIFAKEKNAAEAFNKGQKIMEKVIGGTIVICFFIVGLMMWSLYLIGKNKEDAAIMVLLVIIFLAIAALFVVAWCYKKVKPLEEAYKNKVIIYTQK